MSKENGFTDFNYDNFKVDHSFKLLGDTKFKSLYIPGGSVLNQNGHRFLVDNWTHVEGVIVNAGFLIWPLIQIHYWIKRQSEKILAKIQIF